MVDSTQTIWGTHAGRTGDADGLFKKGVIALGWNRIGSLSEVAPTRDAIKQVMAAAYPDDKPGSIPVSAGQLYRFAHEMKPGDLVIFRSKPENVFWIGEVIGPYRHDSTLDPGYPHLRSVTWRTSVSPMQVSQGALYEMGAAMSLFQVRNYADEWLALLSGKKPSIVDSTSPVDDDGPQPENIEQLTSDFILKRLSQELKGHPFADFVAHVLQTMGYRTRVSPEGADGGVDIVAHRDELGFEPPIIRVQVKSGSGNVGQPEVSALLGTLSQGEFGLVVTLAGFTPPARNFAKNKAHLRLIDGPELVDLVLAHYEEFDPRYKGLLPLKRVYVPQPIDTDA